MLTFRFAFESDHFTPSPTGAADFFRLAKEPPRGLRFLRLEFPGMLRFCDSAVSASALAMTSKAMLPLARQDVVGTRNG